MDPQRPTRRQPGYIRLINSMGEFLGRAGFSGPRLCPATLQRRAEQRTGLRDWGDEGFVAGLAQLTAALNTQARLTPLGRVVAGLNLWDHLCVRLRLIDYRARRGEVAEQQIRRPLFILGLPRSGTTILHELIAQDPACRAPASWEVARPLPPPRADSYDSDRRIAPADRTLAWMERLAPGFRVIHAIGARLPQECVYMLASAFASDQFGYMYDVPDYRSWLMAQDMTAAYRWHAGFLQHLQVDCARDRWVLKTPAHLGYLRYLMAQYPDAAVVWTHRRPLDSVASMSSLVTTLRGAFSSSVDPLAAGDFEFRHYAEVLRRGVADRRALDTGQFFDVSFRAVCEDPIAVIGGIYAYFGFHLSDEAERRMRAYLRQHPRDLYGVHHYSRAGFGLEESAERSQYGEYLAQYAGYLA